MNLAERAAATERVVARFRDAPFSWKGRRTCIHLARAQMRAMDHRPPSVPDIRSPSSAKLALRRYGAESLVQLLDSLLPRIPPLAMIVGDLGVLPGEDELEAIVICAGGSKVMGYHGNDLSRITPIEVTKADFVAAYAVGR